jgi:FixJ family two-component response regulator
MVKKHSFLRNPVAEMPCIILLDRIRRMNGIEFCKRGDVMLKGLPVVVLTSRGGAGHGAELPSGRGGAYAQTGGL